MWPRGCECGPAGGEADRALSQHARKVREGGRDGVDVGAVNQKGLDECHRATDEDGVEGDRREDAGVLAPDLASGGVSSVGVGVEC